MNGTAADTLAVSPPPLRNLCDSHGRLDPRAVGWSARPRVLCHIPGHFGRRKRWNHWCIVSPGWMLSLTIADLDYLTYGAAYFLDLDSGQAVAHTQIRFFGLGCQLPDEPQASHAFEHPRLQLRFDEQPGRLRVTGQAPDLGGLPLELALEVRRPSHLESVNLVVPMGEHTFHACSRQLGLPISGCLQLGRRRYDCQAGQSFAALDFGRGVWPLHTYWTRAAFAAPAASPATSAPAGPKPATCARTPCGSAASSAACSTTCTSASLATRWPNGAWTAPAVASSCSSVPNSCTRRGPASACSMPIPASGSAVSTAPCATTTATACRWTAPSAGSVRPARAGDAGGGQSISDPQRGEKCPRGSDGSGTQGGSEGLNCRIRTLENTHEPDRNR
ncbi:hypothetical protein CSC36_3477 [Pseudomonas aeruginosa]|nr:hypothetical protein CSC36_3477 [Pseudomonas aeruginosa]